MRCHCNHIVHFIKHTAQVGKDRPTNGKTGTDAEGRALGVHGLCFDLLCILRQLFLPAMELLLCVFHLGPEVFSVRKVIALERGRGVIMPPANVKANEGTQTVPLPKVLNELSAAVHASLRLQSPQVNQDDVRFLDLSI